jgi:hypothetical protein
MTGIKDAFKWIHDVSGWSDPVHGSIEGMDGWITVAIDQKNYGIVSLTPGEITDPIADAAGIDSASNALNANFYIGGTSGSRFNWMGGWE